jgi:hypothetical protein
MTSTIGICGICLNSLSNVANFLKEFDENIVLDKKIFGIPYFPDGLDDLSYYLHKGCSDWSGSIVAIERFKRLFNDFINNNNYKSELEAITKEYMNHIVQARWYGLCYSARILYPSLNNIVINKLLGRLLRIFFKIEKIIKHEINIYPLHKLNYSVNPDNFYEISKKYINELLICMGKVENKNIVLIQPFSLINPKDSFKYFDKPKAIIIDRDPRDLYILLKNNHLYQEFNHIPVDTVENFVLFYRYLKQNIKYFCENQIVLNIQFEDMIYEYDKTKKRMADFLELTKHSKPNYYFTPTDYVNEMLPNISYTNYKKEICYIEKELNEYLWIRK